jgi:hypothetical protein
MPSCSAIKIDHFSREKAQVGKIHATIISQSNSAYTVQEYYQNGRGLGQFLERTSAPVNIGGYENKNTPAESHDGKVYIQKAHPFPRMCLIKVLMPFLEHFFLLNCL